MVIAGQVPPRSVSTRPAIYSSVSAAAYIHLSMPRGVIEPQGDYSTVGVTILATSAVAHLTNTAAHVSGTISPPPSPWHTRR